MWKLLLDRMLRAMISRGRLVVELHDGTAREYGDGVGDPVRVRIRNVKTVRALALYPELALGEAYMSRDLTIADDDVDGLLSLVIQNLEDLQRMKWHRSVHRVRTVFRGLSQLNFLSRARRNVAHHYDLSGQLYDLFLDADRQYSCAYYKSPSDSLEQAQAQKKEHISRKLLLQPGMRVLDIGCGWGGLALHLARHHDVQVLGITLSEEQYDVACRKAARAGLSDCVEFRLCDYRKLDAQFDRIVSVGMFEHVGLLHYDTFFRMLHDSLTPDGIAVLHTIGWAGAPQGSNPWITKYIFPGGYVPSLSEAVASIERAGLWAADVECWRLHYAYTLQHWQDRFEANSDAIRALYDDEFVRMWRFYLSSCKQSFRNARQAVFQFQLSRKVDAVPVTRDYLYGAQGKPQALSAAE